MHRRCLAGKPAGNVRNRGFSVSVPQYPGYLWEEKVSDQEQAIHRLSQSVSQYVSSAPQSPTAGGDGAPWSGPLQVAGTDVEGCVATGRRASRPGAWAERARFGRQSVPRAFNLVGPGKPLDTQGSPGSHPLSRCSPPLSNLDLNFLRHLYCGWWKDSDFSRAKAPLPRDESGQPPRRANSHRWAAHLMGPGEEPEVPRAASCPGSLSLYHVLDDAQWQTHRGPSVQRSTPQI